MTDRDNAHALLLVSLSEAVGYTNEHGWKWHTRTDGSQVFRNGGVMVAEVNERKSRASWQWAVHDPRVTHVVATGEHASVEAAKVQCERVLHAYDVLEACARIKCDSLANELRDLAAVANSAVVAQGVAEKWADKLAYAVAPVEKIGEHTNLNNPWERAHEILRSREMPFSVADIAQQCQVPAEVAMVAMNFADGDAALARKVISAAMDNGVDVEAVVGVVRSLRETKALL